MKIKILSSLWGYEQYPLKEIIGKIKEAGYEGIDTFIPDEEDKKKQLLDLIRDLQLCLVVQQHQAKGETFSEFKQSYIYYLERSAEAEPLLINSHTGRDYFSFEQNMELLETAQSLSKKTGIEIVHETHRGRFGFSPSAIQRYFDRLPGLNITADLSHWTCVTESFLEGFVNTLQEAFARTRHIHARIGYEEGPQVPDPRAPEWQHALDIFVGWWDAMIRGQIQQGREILTITTEFGPVPYMPTIPFSNKPVADLFEINSYMKDLLEKRFSSI